MSISSLLDVNTDIQFNQLANNANGQHYNQPPEGGYAPPRRVMKFKESVWDKAAWPASNLPIGKVIRKGKGREMYLVCYFFAFVYETDVKSI